MGKRTAMSEFVVQNRGGKGVKCYKITEKTGNVVGAKAVNEENEIMMITTGYHYPSAVCRYLCSWKDHLRCEDDQSYRRRNRCKYRQGKR